MNCFELDLLKVLKERIKASTHESRINNILIALQLGIYSKEEEIKIRTLLENELSYKNTKNVLERTR